MKVKTKWTELEWTLDREGEKKVTFKIKDDEILDDKVTKYTDDNILILFYISNGDCCCCYNFIKTFKKFYNLMPL